MRVLCFAAAVLLLPQDPTGPLKVPAAHPRVVMAPEDLPALRERARTGPWGAVEAAARRWLETLDPTRPLESTSSLQARCHSLSEAAATIAFYGLVGGIDEERKRIGGFFEALDVRGIEEKLPVNEFMPRGELLYGLAMAYDWAHPYLSPKARANLGAIVRRNAEENFAGISQKKSWEATSEANNHSMAAMGGVGVAGLAMWGEHPDAKAWVDLAARKVKVYLDTSFDEDGAGYEGNLYGQFGAGMALPFAASLKRHGGSDLFGDGRLVRIMRWIAADLMPGGRKLNPLNDASGGAVAGNVSLYAASVHHDGVSRWLWEKAGQSTWAPYRFLWEESAGTSAEPGPEFRAMRFRGRGLVSVRTGYGDDDAMASFECGARRPGCHGQSDQGQITLYGAGGEFIVDTLYSNVDQEGSAHQSVGHNLVLIDGKGQAISGGGKIVEGKPLAYSADDVAVLATGDLAPAYGARDYNGVTKAVRTFAWITTAKRPYLVVVDEVVKGGGARKYESLLHTAPGNTVEWDKEGARIRAAASTLRVRHFTPFRIAAETRTMGFKAPSLGDHPVLAASSTAPGWFCATLFAFEEEGVAFEGSCKGQRVELRAKREGEEDLIVVGFRVDKAPASVEITRKAAGKTVYRKKFP